MFDEWTNDYCIVAPSSGGTRYLMLIKRDGCYLFDMDFDVLRFELLFNKSMIMNNDNQRTYEIHDVFAVDGITVLKRPFNVRFSLIETEILSPKNKFHSLYDWEKEPFKVIENRYRLSVIEDGMKKVMEKDEVSFADSEDITWLNGRINECVPKMTGKNSWKFVCIKDKTEPSHITEYDLVMAQIECYRYECQVMQCTIRQDLISNEIKQLPRFDRKRKKEVQRGDEK
ncbi:OLC1v1035078C1 [Oldenlandia corymbosa var. corymbosa]|uniref:OLC1v1035078C1 n=1 Tax=Oldenlandia corymbosa var. corymbosa TaxID=529605 RepID=A0AAV1CS30_OLDCO|nr:OLC1v1035078C1 [Oldenlandia corymbosa var. corymbosa]